MEIGKGVKKSYKKLGVCRNMRAFRAEIPAKMGDLGAKRAFAPSVEYLPIPCGDLQRPQKRGIEDL